VAYVERTVSAEPGQIRAALADGWSYADWVVGAVHVRGVDESWPSPGSVVHHRLGGWPLTLDDETRVTAWDDDGHVELRAKLRPFGTATIRVTWRPIGNGRCRVTMEEQFVEGVARLAQMSPGQAMIRARNTECLRRLEDLSQRYSAHGGPPSDGSPNQPS
jgi:Polyketide cyclase / dehydrase and lipid transport